MGRTYRRNPYARELEKKQYRGKRMPDKRRQRMDELEAEEGNLANVICIRCGKNLDTCGCTTRTPNGEEYES